MNEPILLQIGTSGLWDSGTKWSTFGSGGQRSSHVKVTKAIFGDISQELFLES